MTSEPHRIRDIHLTPVAFRLRLAVDALAGVDVWHVHEISRRIATALTADDVAGGHGMSGMVTGSRTNEVSTPPSRPSRSSVRSEQA